MFVASLKQPILAALGIALAALSFGTGSTFGAELSIRDVIFSQETLYRPDRFEVRGGGFAHCCFVESGSTALGLEIVTPRLFTLPALPEFFTPRFHFGGIVDLNGHTSYGYGGLLFTFNITQRIFAEPFIGIAVSNGVKNGDATHNAIGCTTLIHSGGNIGYRLNQNLSVMLTLDHISNGGLCSRNLGVNNYGGKIGYNF